MLRRLAPRRLGWVPFDVLARIGGEEFGLLLPGCSAHQALQVVERLRHDMPPGLTASAGIAAWSEPTTDQQLVARADRELYRAQGRGPRPRVPQHDALTLVLYELRLVVRRCKNESCFAECPREIAKRSSGDSPPEEGERPSLGIRARMPGCTSLVS